MQDLQALELNNIRLGPGMALELPASLTSIRLGDVMGQGLTSSTVQDLAQLTNLAHLELDRVPLDGNLLSAVPQLRWLVMGQVSPASRPGQVDSSRYVKDLKRQATLGKAVLGALGQMTQLQVRSLFGAAVGFIWIM